MFEKQFGAQSKETNRKQMNGPFREEKKDAYIHISQPHTYIQHTRKNQNTHTHTRTGRLPAFNIIHKENL